MRAVDAHLRQIEERLQVGIRARGNEFQVMGEAAAVASAGALLQHLYREIGQGVALTPESLHLQLQQAGLEALAEDSGDEGDKVEALQLIRTRRGSIKPRGRNQQNYVRTIQRCDINFGIGARGHRQDLPGGGLRRGGAAGGTRAADPPRAPGGGGRRKTRLPPGRPRAEVDPYLRPLYDALYEMLGFETVNKYIERSIIEVAPLAFMRGRTLNHSFIILDEAQNTTREQMKMFLTRIGFGSTAVITGDATQIDLPRGMQSGLTHAANILQDVGGIGFTWFANQDVVRHPLVQRIVAAYDAQEAKAPPTSVDKGAASADRGHTARQRRPIAFRRGAAGGCQRRRQSQRCGAGRRHGAQRANRKSRGGAAAERALPGA